MQWPDPAKIKEIDMITTVPEQNKALVLEAFDTLFNKRDYASAVRFWSNRYIQHSAHIAPGREGLFDLIRTAPATLRYENQLIVAEGDYVIAHGRFSGNGRPAAWIAADILRIASSPSTGTSSRTKQRKPNPQAGCRCSGTASPPDRSTTDRNKGAHAPQLRFRFTYSLNA
jgi:predicted SnoaL-like aldol condensation-catalyzing enzyme